MAFKITKKLDLGYLGEGWIDCYLEFEALSIKDTKQLASMQVTENATQKEQIEASEKVVALLQQKFVRGRAFNGEEVVVVTKKDIEELPLEVIPKAIETLVGGSQKN